MMTCLDVPNLSVLITEALAKVQSQFPRTEWTKFDPESLHLSLSRAFSLRHHEITPFVQLLSQYRYIITSTYITGDTASVSLVYLVFLCSTMF